MNDRITLRPAVRAFAEAMERKLRANDHKSGWEDMAPQTLLLKLNAEARELRFEVEGADELERETPRLIRDEAADVANMAMMIADVFASLGSGVVYGPHRPDLTKPTIIIPGHGRVPLWDPRPEHIHPLRMARSLSREGRYANLGDFNYFVAEHLWLASMLCPEAPLQAAVHDGQEAWLGDLIGPLKQLLRLVEGTDISAFDIIEERWWFAVAERFRVPREIHPRVAFVDKALRVCEQRVLYSDSEQWIGPVEGVGPHWLAEESERLGLREPLTVRCLSSGEAYELYVGRLRKLGAL
jgi:NTP pyrophosphatase (non-canonical NTP hydrolase)